MRKWLPVVAFGLLAKAILVLASFLWVAIYAHLVNPTESQAHYEAHAAAVSPWIAILGGIPLLYYLCRRLVRGSDRAVAPTALLMFGTCAALDIPLAAAATTPDVAACTIGLATSLAAAYLGARAGHVGSAVAAGHFGGQ